MSKMKKKWFGIFPKLLSAMAFITILPLSVTWFISLQSTTDRIHQNVNRQLEQSAEGLAAYVDTWIEMNYRMLRQNASLMPMKSMEKPNQVELLKAMTKEYNWNYLAFTVDTMGQNIARSDNAALTYYGDREYFKQVINGASHGKQVVIGKTSGKPAFIMSVPISHPTTNTINGVLAIAMTVGDISERITQAKIGNTGYVFLVDNHGKVIAHQSPEFTTTRKDLSDHPAVHASDYGTTNVMYTSGEGKKMVSATRITQYGWKLVAEQEYDEAFAEIKVVNRQALMLIFGTLVFVILVALLLSRGLSIPILRIAAVAEEISSGQLNSKIPFTGRGDEIGALAKAIDRLSASTRIAMMQLARKQEKTRQMETID
jgi:methyl-accepting chemotaxis protein